MPDRLMTAIEDYYIKDDMYSYDAVKIAIDELCNYSKYRDIKSSVKVISINSTEGIAVFAWVENDVLIQWGFKYVKESGEN